MKRRIAAGFLALLLCLFVSVPSFASVASASEIGVSNDSVHNDISSLDDSSVSGVGMGDDAASSDETTSNDTLEDDSVDSGLDDTDTSFASGSVDAPVVPTWSEAVAAVKAQREAASAAEAQIMTLDSIEEDYGIMPLSSLGTVSNTVDRTGVQLQFFGNDWQHLGYSYILADGTIPRFVSSEPIRWVYFSLQKTALPPSGVYDFSFDFSSDISFDVKSVSLNNHRDTDNAESDQIWHSLSTSQYDFLSGDLYVAPITVSLNNQNVFIVVLTVKDDNLFNFSGSARFNFTRSSAEPAFTGIGTSASDIEGDYQAGVTSSLGNIGDTLEEIVETISLQLEALWNQMYNYMHVPELNKLEEIRQAIENIRLDVDVDNQDVVNKLDDQIRNDNANTQHVTNGYDKSTLDDTNSQLSDTFQAQEDQEQDIMEQISQPLDDFEFKNPITQYLSTFLLFGDFLQSLFVSSGAMADVINLSFVITIALMVVGLYRFKGGN